MHLQHRVDPESPKEGDEAHPGEVGAADGGGGGHPGAAGRVPVRGRGHLQRKQHQHRGVQHVVLEAWNVGVESGGRIEEIAFDVVVV